MNDDSSVKLLTRFARRLQTVSDQRIAFTERTSSREPLSVEELSNHLAIDLSVGPRRLNDLEPTDFPVLIRRANGSALLLLDRCEGGLFSIMTEREEKFDRLDALQKAGGYTMTLIRPRLTGDPEQGNRKTPKELAISAIWRNRSALAFSALAAALSNLFILAVPLFTMAVYDRVVPHLAFETLWALAIGVTMVLILDLAVRAVKQQLVDAVGLTAARQLQTDMFERLIGLRLMDRPSEAGTLAKSFADLDQLCTALPLVISALLIDFPFFLLSILLITWLAGPVAWVPLIGAILLAAVATLCRRWAEPLRSLATQTGNRRSNFLIELQSILPWIKISGAEFIWRSRWTEMIDRSMQQNWAAARIDGLASAFNAPASQLISVVVLIVGVHQIAAAEMTVGALIACVLLSGRTLAPVIGGIAVTHRAAEAMRNLQSISDLWEHPPERGGDPQLTEGVQIKGRLAFKSVTFGYPGANAPAIRDISLEFKPGEKVAIIGRNGSGKTTLMKLIARLYDPTAGGILLDDCDLRQYEPSMIRRHVGFAPQEAWMFEGTLRQNLLIGLDTPDQEFASRIMNATGIADFVHEHPNGLGQTIAARGENLSSGQRQSVLLSRALLADAPILLLDEPTAHLDQTREDRLIKELHRLGQTKTVLIATHRLAVLTLVDRVIWIEQGKVVLDKPSDQAMKILRGSAVNEAPTSTDGPLKNNDIEPGLSNHALEKSGAGNL